MAENSDEKKDILKWNHQQHQVELAGWNIFTCGKSENDLQDFNIYVWLGSRQTALKHCK